ncbi:uncharacterized protein A1O9_09727 [Exophiala aquamarina CBS 119918]|uniref:Adenosinetriphosphatase n=1 Tax=Exophiala aquamarina CBS 119918 TaxID=1182545 RepID=A0A072P2K6_9EURO|nr:uncharacterized protein A1O9_09727 [Exophiala aquamarina CBS 119918]KEF53932.1 hypothetical protein A1O9_09727 [Exophiala aquamarina CBS 119918]
MASHETPRNPAPVIIDLACDSDEEEDTCVPLEDAVLLQPAIKVEPMGNMPNPGLTEFREHCQNLKPELPHKEPPSPALSTTIPSSNSAELGTDQSGLQATDDDSDKLGIASDASGLFGSTAAFTPSNDDLQSIPTVIAAQAHSDSICNATSHVDESLADRQADNIFGTSLFQTHCHENFEAQDSTCPHQSTELPELPNIELPGDGDGDGIDDLTPEEAIKLYNMNKSSFDDGNDDRGSETHQNSSHVAQAQIAIDEDADLVLERAITLYNLQNSDSHDSHNNDKDSGPHKNSSYATQANTAVSEDADMIDWVTALDEDTGIKSDRAAAKFARFKEKHDKMVAKGTATNEDSVRFIMREIAEKKRLNDLERSQRRNEDQIPQKGPVSAYQDEDSLFIPETPDRLESSKKKTRAPAKPRNRVNAQETREAMAVGNNPSQARKRRAPASSSEAPPRKKRVTKDGPSKPAKKRTKQPILSNLSSLGRSNIIQEAQANADKPDMPTFCSKNKTTALQELIASIPSAENGAHASDRAAVRDATKKFKGRGAVRSDGQGAWKLRGMRSSLYHHQLLGAAFLRDRENGGQRPFGGMVCDEMGFGKTIQMIANILDGKAEANDPVKTTLIVAPACLLNQWMLELEKHVEPGNIARIIRYHSGARLHSNDLVADLKQYDIILTTYHEVQRSYPACEPPKHLVSEEGKNAWWQKFYMENVGPIHRIKYLRIVLDEAHQIKNYLSKTSMAVRALTGTFRWAITGTPILNYIEELFPYFSFLKVPHTGDYTTFRHNYCQNRSGREPVNMSRIHNILRAIMLRRTHVDTIFNAPIVKLPGISHITYQVEFNEVERAIYNTVKRKFSQDINRMSRSGGLNGGYSNILAMIHHLRRLCNHVLLCQKLLKQTLTAADVEVLWRLTAKEVEPHPEDGQGTIISVLRKMIQSKSNIIATCQSTETDVAGPEALGRDRQEVLDRGGDFGIYFKFRRFLKELTQGQAWTELHLRSICSKCKLPPDEPFCTSCLHVYCKECLSTMEFERVMKKENKVSCIECGANFESTSPCTGLQELGFNSEDVAKRVQNAKDKPNSGSSRNERASVSSEDGNDDDRDWIELGGVTLSSAKLRATKAAVLNWRKDSPNEKILIYTQFLDTVRLLEKVFKAEGWAHVQFTGKTSLSAREKAINQFTYDKDTSIMILSLKAGGVGLNFNMASKVVILDLWFNSSIEAQAYCRAFRIGQKRKVEVFRFVVKDTIDEELIAMQDRKDVEVTGAIGPETHGGRATIAQLLGLFGEVVEEGQNGFILMEDEDQVDDANVDMVNLLPPRPF